jgi:hypothetical protein
MTQKRSPAPSHPSCGEVSTMQLAKRTKNGNEGWECKFVIPYERALTVPPTHERFEFRQLNASVTPPPPSTQVESADGEKPSEVLISQVFLIHPGVPLSSGLVRRADTEVIDRLRFHNS